MNFVLGCFVGMLAGIILFSVLSTGADEDRFMVGFEAGYKQAVDEYAEKHKVV